MKTFTIEHHIGKETEGRYYLLPFLLEGCADPEVLTVSYTYPKKGQGLLGREPEPCIVDLGLQGPDGEFLGWSGSSRGSVFISAADSTEGYLTRSVTPGEWGILVGAYKVPAGGVDVTYTVSLGTGEPRFYYGDTHVHSTASDGRLAITELGALAKKRGLDFLCLANHNNYSENFSLPHVNGLSFIPAVEWTHYKGHMNLYGVAAPFENGFVANSQEEMDDLLARAREMGATVSVNHPDCPLCPYLWEDRGNYDMIEIWNGPMTARNTRAIARWTRALNEGRHLPCTGGSDFHRPHDFARLGRPVLALWAADPSPASLLEAMREGHSFVTARPGGPFAVLRCGNAFMGDTASPEDGRPHDGAPLESGRPSADGQQSSGGRTVTLETKRCGHLRLTAVTNLGETRVRGGAFTVPDGARYVYVKGSFLGVVRIVTNPIYFAD